MFRTSGFMFFLKMSSGKLKCFSKNCSLYRKIAGFG